MTNNTQASQQVPSELPTPEIMGSLLDLPEHVQQVIKAYGDARERVALHNARSAVLAAATPTCPTCNGNDRDMPCAYPSKSMQGCLRDKRLAAATPGQVEADAEFEILQDDYPIASSFGPRARAAREALHYAAQHAQDGELTIVEVTRKAITIDALKSASVSEQKGEAK